LSSVAGAPGRAPDQPAGRRVGAADRAAAVGRDDGVVDRGKDRLAELEQGGALEDQARFPDEQFDGLLLLLRERVLLAGLEIQHPPRVGAGHAHAELGHGAGHPARVLAGVSPAVHVARVDGAALRVVERQADQALARSLPEVVRQLQRAVTPRLPEDPEPAGILVELEDRDVLPAEVLREPVDEHLRGAADVVRFVGEVVDKGQGHPQARRLLVAERHQDRLGERQPPAPLDVGRRERLGALAVETDERDDARAELHRQAEDVCLGQVRLRRAWFLCC
jgi:hypothetical protein